MKTTFILHGGRLRYENQHNDSFFREITKNLKDGDIVLFVGFARKDQIERENIYERDRELILRQTEKKIIVENAKEESLIDQVKKSKAIFVCGGDTLGLQKIMEKYEGLTDAIKGKIFAGSSAGALICAKYYFACSAKAVYEGFGWLPICLMVHYGNPEFNSTDETLEELKQYSDSLELIALPECEWTLREIDL